MMKTALVLSLVLALGCTKANPDFCCATEADCNAAGVDELRPCRAGQACNADHVCVAAQCQTSSECMSAESPRCLNGFCVPGCADDSDCTGISNHPYCLENSCVECKFAAQCPMGREICDIEDHACRGCRADDECASAVCIEADGTCAVASDVIYIDAGGTDSGDCPKSAPCRTIAYGVGRTTGSRRIVKLIGATYAGATPVILTSVVIDGVSSNIIAGSRPIFTVSLSSDVVIEGVRLDSNDGSNAIEVASNGRLRLADTVIDHAGVTNNNATVELLRARLVNGSGIDCTNGMLTIENSELDRSAVGTMFCRLVVRASHLGPSNSNNSVIRVIGGLLTIENNLFTEVSEFVDLVYLYSYSNGSTFRFNTLVNSSQATITSYGLFCGAGPTNIDVSSNVFSYGTQPAEACGSKYSLFDQAGSQTASGGQNNVVGERALFFKNQAMGDYHLAAGSPAIGIGDPTLAGVDRDGNARPMPAGTRPDSGAYEAP